MLIKVKRRLDPLSIRPHDVIETQQCNPVPQTIRRIFTRGRKRKMSGSDCIRLINHMIVAELKKNKIPRRFSDGRYQDIR